MTKYDITMEGFETGLSEYGLRHVVSEEFDEYYDELIIEEANDD